MEILLQNNLAGLVVFSDISEGNNNYSATLDFRRGRVVEVGVVTFFVLEVPDYESAMFIYIHVKNCSSTCRSDVDSCIFC